MVDREGACVRANRVVGFSPEEAQGIRLRKYRG